MTSDMNLHPFIEKMIGAARDAGRPALSAGTAQQARDLVASGRAALGAGPVLRDISDIRIPTRGGGVGGRLYRSQRPERGLIVYLHGGGWLCGTMDDYEVLAATLVDASDCALLQVDYRLAPEHPFPAGLEDAQDAMAWAAAQVPVWLGRALPLVVAGDSAGANLGTVALAALRGKVDAVLQVLLYPVVDVDTERPSYRAYGEGLPLTRADMQWFFRHYAPPEVWGDPRISPLRSDDLSGLPPAYVVVAEYDVLRDEAEAYAARLRDAGVAVELHRAGGMTHGFARMVNLVDVARDVVADTARAIVRHCEAHDLRL